MRPAHEARATPSMTRRGPCLTDWLERQWYDRAPVAYGLKPLAQAFAGVVRIRRWAYAVGLKPIERLTVPVIVVGNLSVGGTGKTPLSIWLVEFLATAGFQAGVISRGYGGPRDRSEPMRVYPDTDPALCGDEPALIALRTSAPVMVGRDRVAAARALLREARCDVLIADDGLQHYRLGRDIEILLVDGERRFGNGHCLPAGPLREPIERAHSVDFVVCRGGQPEAGEYAMTILGETAHNLLSGEVIPLTGFLGTPVRAVAGIAHPGRFFRELQAWGLDIEPQAFPDHHAYQPRDLAFADDRPVLMTEKDAVKCRRFASERLWYVPVQARLEPGFGDALLQPLRNPRHG